METIELGSKTELHYDWQIMPIGIVDRTVGIVPFFIVTKWTPPVFDNHRQVSKVTKQGDTHRAVDFTVENPVPTKITPVEACGFAFVGDLIMVLISM